MNRVAIHGLASERTRRVRVLLAEDDRAMREMITAALRRRGYEVLEARSGVDLLDLLEMGLAEGELPLRRTVIVSDIRMRHLDGLRLLEAVQGLGLDIPVFLISAFADGETERLALGLGARAVLPKPFDLDFLEQSLRGAFGEVPPPVGPVAAEVDERFECSRWS